MKKTSQLNVMVSVFCALTLSACSAFDDQHHGMTEQKNTKPSPPKIAPVATKSNATNKKELKNGLVYQPDARDKLYANADEELRAWHDPLVSGYQPDHTHKALVDYASQIAMQLMNNANEIEPDDLIGVASFVRLNASLRDTTVLGNQLSELLITEIQSYGLGVVDFKMAGDITVTPKGDLAMRRSVQRKPQKLAMDHILTGTLIEEPRGVRVNARIVSTANNQVVASTTLLIPAFMVTQLNHTEATSEPASVTSESASAMTRTFKARGHR
ncbi:FlgO family outer membrane protein [Alteromonas sp. 14N.309.X.WAT.G.H12]|uniref:FlgO family outer membrane protein n=1 Tax=Alteromonas sp. 14N.309.X.WAT.G.H12 TaxID=3120824 RepID=UPI002FCFE264